MNPNPNRGGGRRARGRGRTNSAGRNWREPSNGPREVNFEACFQIRPENYGGAYNRPNEAGQQPPNPQRDRRPAQSQPNTPRRSRPPRFGFKRLEQIIGKNPEEALLEIIGLKDAVLEFINVELSNDCIVLLVKLFATISQSVFKENVASVLSIYTNVAFSGKLEVFIARLHLQSVRERNGNRHFWNDVNGFFNNLAVFCNALLDVIPNKSSHVLPSLLKAVIYTIPNVEREYGMVIPDEVKVAFENLQVKLLSLVEKALQASDRKHREGDLEPEEVEPLDDFHDISIYPLSEELFSKHSYGIRKNKIEGGYTGVEQYLDIQFRLLREDFVAPLRHGIAEYLSKQGNKRASNIKIYKDVHVLYKKLVNSEMGSVIQVFAKGHLKNVERTKRLMFGSLVAFTEDNFRNLKFGKVIDRDLAYLRKGQVVVGFCDDTELEFNKNYTMLECLVYFEPYYHVLNALQQMRVEKFPLREYLVDVINSHELPGYLTNGDNLEYEKLIDVPVYEYEFSDDDNVEQILERAGDVKSEIHELPVNHTNLWLDREEMGLNGAQYLAFKAALTQKFCIIQGPPGTGKTFLGLKIAKLLLFNKKKWSETGPMLVICYTNHALDQFLEGLTSATDKLVRVGGQSRNDNLKQYNLKNHRFRYSKNTPALLKKRDALQQQKILLDRMNSEFYEIIEADCVMDLFNGDGFGSIDPEFAGSWFYNASKNDILSWLLEEALTWNVNLEQVQNQTEEAETFEMDDLEVANQKSKHDLDLEEETVASKYKEATVLISVAAIIDQIFGLKKRIEKMDQNTGVYHQSIRELRSLMQNREYLTQKLGALREQFENMRKPLFYDYKDPLKMRYGDRWGLYRYWLNSYRIRLRELVVRAEEEYRTLYRQYEEVRDMYDAIYMKKCDVIGMTTTGAARLQTTLMTLNCPIVIVEEAAEVLEAHIVTALTDKCQHLILIGDHKQLRPSTADYVLDKKFNLGISLFERMILNGFDSNTLNIQHRMRPEIANLVCPSVYEKLENHESVTNYPPIKGVEKSMFFVTHDKPEKQSSDSSKENHFEATYMIMLAHYLVLNGYKPEKITILSAYAGQFFQLLKERRSFIRLKDVKITILDNYQGEENDIILLSLVRNNNENKIGFLSLENRVCVALSRAKMGLYVMGNIDLLCQNSKIWPKIRLVLDERECVGTALPLKCHNHPDNRTPITNIEDFNQVPEGGCTLICNKLRDCGHRCPNMCHVLPHSSYQCFEPCLRILCEFNHGCPKMCNEECGMCVVPKSVKLPCGHTHDIPCHQEPGDYQCPTEVEVTLKCGHLVKKPCSTGIKLVSCTHPCEARIEPCGHACTNLCHIDKDPKHLKYKCYKPCERSNLDCSMPEDPDHKCPNLCSDKCSPCTITVHKKRTVCSHAYPVKCHEDVDLLTCKKPCKRMLKCGHACKQKCSVECGDCAVNVKKTIEECGHEVKFECSKIPARKDCTQQCASTLRCGHKCAFKCKVDCYKNPCKVLVTVRGRRSPCGHTVTVPCFLKDLYTPEEALKHCTEPCDVKLACEHKCTGTCGTCHQQRLHVQCKEKCTNTLICGHDCKVPCRSMCQPCTRPCSYRCKHSVCKKNCGDPCTDCVEKCTRRCPHGACKKLCNQECDVPPCSEPCAKTLKCGHACIGYCGDPCPPHCSICTEENGDEDTVMEIFFGTEQDEGARFVYLEECGHILEGSSLDQWFATATESSEVTALCCPKCKTAVSKTQRYSDYIKKSFKDLQTVKKKFFGDRKKNHIDHQGLLTKSHICRTKYYQIKLVGSLVSGWTDALGKFPNEQLINDCRSKLQIVEDLCETYVSAKVLKDSPKTILDKQLNFLLEYVKTISNISNQNISDYQWELKRFTRISQMCKIMDNAKIRYESLPEYIECKALALTHERYSEAQDASLKMLLKSFNEKTLTGLNITDKERKEIISAMGLATGHWFKCAKGHIYAIGECGGAMQTSQCPECGAKIGGTNHALLPGNALAPEMDSARYPAYSDTANMLNFELNDLM